MAFDDALAARVRNALSAQPGVEERKMFGGLAFLVRGHMSCGIVGDRLMVRVARESYDEALAQPHVRPMDFTGRPMRGFIYVEPAGIRTGPMLSDWIGKGVAYVSSLPPK